MYKLIINDQESIIIRTSDGAAIPLDLNNKDYQEYLNWESEGNEAVIESY